MSKSDTYGSDEPIAQSQVTRTFDADDVAEFASLSGDENPLHLDPDYAAETRFGEPIVHGALVASLISAALARFEGTVIYVEQDVEFQSPVYPGEQLTATATIYDSSDAYHTVLTRVETEGGKTAVTGTAEIIIDRSE